jgi:hypothetical protein
MAMADKYLPQLKELTSLSDDDLFYYVNGGDFKTTLQGLRKLINPSNDSMGKIVSYNIPVNECYGDWFSNSVAFSAISFNLPPSQDGLYVGFIVEQDKNLLIKPVDSNLIIGLSTFGGQPIKSAHKGSSIVLRSTAHNWHVWKQYGFWST